MTRNEFLSEIKEVFEAFEKEPNETYLNLLFGRVDSATVPEFRAMKLRVLDECEFFPRITKWVHLKHWILEKRIRLPMSTEYTNCEDCLNTGLVKVIARGASTLVKCSCDESNKWQRHIPTLEQVDYDRVVKWNIEEFKPTSERSFDNRVEWFNETINIAEQFWKHSKFYKTLKKITTSV